MKLKTTLFYSWIIFSFIVLYFSFKTKASIYLFSLFGYDIGLQSIYSNMPIKISYFILTIATAIQIKIDSKKTLNDIAEEQKVVKKKKNKILNFKQTIKAQ